MLTTEDWSNTHTVHIGEHFSSDDVDPHVEEKIFAPIKIPGVIWYLFL